jgi:kynureninase
MTFNKTIEYARELDRQDELRKFRSLFVVEDPDTIYMDGNSLGRTPKTTVELIRSLSEQWSGDLINGWKNGWFDLSQRVGAKIAKLIGAGPDEVIIADSTSINLFKLVLAALQADPAKKVVVSDELNFPSDLHALQGAINMLGGRRRLRTMRSHDRMTISNNELERAIRPDVGLVSLTQTAFKSGFTYDMEAVTRMAHDAGALILWDLSHSVGAIPIELDKCKADMAIGSTYKYLNGGPGSPAFLYIKRDLQKKLNNPLTGWFGQKDQFKFSIEHEPAKGIVQFLTGTPPIFSIAPIEIGVDISLQAGIAKIRNKSIKQTSYFIELSRELLSPLGVSLNSPEDAELRGAHVSLGHREGYAIDRALINEMKVVPDFRHPNNIRYGMAPLYTSFEDIHHAVTRTRTVLTEKLYKKYSKAITGVT